MEEKLCALRPSPTSHPYPPPPLHTPTSPIPHVLFLAQKEGKLQTAE